MPAAAPAAIAMAPAASGNCPAPAGRAPGGQPSPRGCGAPAAAPVPVEGWVGRWVGGLRSRGSPRSRARRVGAWERAFSPRSFKFALLLFFLGAAASRPGAARLPPVPPERRRGAGERPCEPQLRASPLRTAGAPGGGRCRPAPFGFLGFGLPPKIKDEK